METGWWGVWTAPPSRDDEDRTEGYARDEHGHHPRCLGSERKVAHGSRGVDGAALSALTAGLGGSR
jgi:hypothetical protein